MGKRERDLCVGCVVDVVLVFCELYGCVYVIFLMVSGGIYCGGLVIEICVDLAVI